MVSGDGRFYIHIYIRESWHACPAFQIIVKPSSLLSSRVEIDWWFLASTISPCLRLVRLQIPLSATLMVILHCCEAATGPHLGCNRLTCKKIIYYEVTMNEALITH
jgi:hypothetical protein